MGIHVSTQFSGWEYAFGNNVQMRLFIMKIGIVSSIDGYVGEETGWGLKYKPFFCLKLLRRKCDSSMQN